jgi:hypothetical protein
MLIENFAKSISEIGWVAVPDLLSEDFIITLRNAMETSYETCRKIQIANGLPATDGTLHHLLGQNKVYLELFDQTLFLDYIDVFFGRKWILNSYGGVINLPSKESYVHNVHRDLRTFSKQNVMLNMLVMVDEFTLENGATWFLDASHKSPEQPADNQFFSSASRACGLAGTVVFFNSNLWHAAGVNHSSKIRRALTLNFTFPNMKQQFDYPRAIGYEKCESLTDRQKQLVGFFARTPSTLEEWYQKPDNRFYRPDQG